MHWFYFLLFTPHSPPSFLRRKKQSSLVPVLEGKGDMPKLISIFKVISRLLPCAVGIFYLKQIQNVLLLFLKGHDMFSRIW